MSHVIRKKTRNFTKQNIFCQLELFLFMTGSLSDFYLVKRSDTRKNLEWLLTQYQFKVSELKSAVKCTCPQNYIYPARFTGEGIRIWFDMASYGNVLQFRQKIVSHHIS